MFSVKSTAQREIPLTLQVKAEMMNLQSGTRKDKNRDVIALPAEVRKLMINPLRSRTEIVF